MSAARPEDWLLGARVDMRLTHEVMPQQYLGKYYDFLTKLNSGMRLFTPEGVESTLERLNSVLDKTGL